MSRLLALALLFPAGATAVPLELNHQGRFLDTTGSPLTGDHTVVVSLYETETSTDVLWSEDHGNLPFDEGYYSLTLGVISALDSDLFDASSRWIGLEIDGAPALRLPIQSVPYALLADGATNVSGGTVTASSVTVGDVVIDVDGIHVGDSTVINANGAVSGASWEDLQGIPSDVSDGDSDTLAAISACGEGDVAVYDGSAWTCAGTISLSRLSVGDTSDTLAAGDHTHPAEDLTSGTLDVARLPIGTGADQVAAGDHSHDLADLSGTLTLGDVTDACDSSLLGAVRFVDDVFEGCTSTGWVSLGRGGATGSTAEAAGESCKQILDDHGSSDGVYWIDPDGSGSLSARELYCDMSGGGYTLVGALGNRWAPTPAPSAFFTQDISQTSTDWSANSSRKALDPSGRGVVKTDDWPAPSEIRYQNVLVATETVKNEVRCEGSSTIAHLRTFTDKRDARAGSATCYSVPFDSDRTFYFADDHTTDWHYWGGIMGRSPQGTNNGWQFGLSVNDPDGVGAYDGVHDDQGRAEYNIGVGAMKDGDRRDVTGYWEGSPGCTSGCNEDWAANLGANAAVTYVWYR